MEIRNDLTFIVYCTTCKVNGKIYIGVHGTKNPDIFDGYLGNGIYRGYTLKNPHTAFQYALKKYGYDNFNRVILYRFSNSDDAYKKEAELVTKEFIRQKDNYNMVPGGQYSGLHYTTIYQYDRNGKLLKEWFSVQDAIEYYGCNPRRFAMAINSKYSAFNSYWSYNKYDILDITEYRKAKHSEIDCYDLNGVYIDTYNSVAEIQKAFNFTKASIEDSCSHKHPLQGYYFISDDSNIYNIIKNRELLSKITDTSVSKYKDGHLIKTYPSLKQAAKENNTSTTAIKNSMKNNECIWAYGYSEVFRNTYTPKTVKIGQYDLEGNFIKIWDSLSSCRKEHPKVKDVLAGTRNHTHGFKFKIID